jgi:hypothetical protein
LEKHNGCFLLLYIGFLEICLQNFVSVRSLRDVKQRLEIIPDVSGSLTVLGNLLFAGLMLRVVGHSVGATGADGVNFLVSISFVV